MGSLRNLSGSGNERQVYRQICEMLMASHNTVILTGAGISTGSGIPDFRSPGRGLWEFSDPMTVASIWGFREYPKRFYDWIRPLGKRLMAARPNPAHAAIVRLEELGLVQVVITQNIDGLHQQAGSDRVLELHGHTQSGSCLACKRTVDGSALWRQVLEADEPPRCAHCGDLLRPDVVLFGEDLPPHVLQDAQQAALHCDLMVVAGSSLEVMPAADLPLLAKRRGARLVVINLGSTLADLQADLVMHGDVTVVLPRIAQQCAQVLGDDRHRRQGSS
jgi:NAD-dependent deacetylase